MLCILWVPLEQSHFRTSWHQDDSQERSGCFRTHRWVWQGLVQCQRRLGGGEASDILGKVEYIKGSRKLWIEIT